jgi:hypothetical protein
MQDLFQCGNIQIFHSTKMNTQMACIQPLQYIPIAPTQTKTFVQSSIQNF